MEFKVGDTVRLKSGGPVMAVDFLRTDGSVDSVGCCWFDSVGCCWFAVKAFLDSNAGDNAIPIFRHLPDSAFFNPLCLQKVGG